MIVARLHDSVRQGYCCQTELIAEYKPRFRQILFSHTIIEQIFEMSILQMSHIFFQEDALLRKYMFFAVIIVEKCGICMYFIRICVILSM